MDVDHSSAVLSAADNWQYFEDPVWYGGKIAVFNTCSSSASLNMSFHGISIALYGYAHNPWVGLDNNSKLPLPSWRDVVSYWYQSSSLSDQEHELHAQIGGPSYIDYALIEVGSTTSLAGKTIFVDDANDEIWYTGQWTVLPSALYSHQSPDRTPGPKLPDGYHHTANRTARFSTTPGDFFEFHFAGTSISVYGFYSPPANYTVDFFVDNEISTQVQYKLGANEWMMNYKLYENTMLSPGNHTLVVKITNLQDGSRFFLDYITYTPSFSFVHEKPAFVRVSNASLVLSAPTQPSGLPTAAIVGIVIAGLLFVVFVGTFYIPRIRRSVSRKQATVACSVESFATHFPSETKPKPLKWNPSEDTNNSIDSIEEPKSTYEPPRIPVEVQQNDDTASLAVEMRNSDDSTREELFARIIILTMELKRLVRENAPPEYGGSDVGQRLSSHSGALPSYYSRHHNGA
ncbi:hypothetical protein VNI00_014750 [Paramarasmius palmivorus]